jgi:MATE family multidrug resistance protein
MCCRDGTCEQLRALILYALRKSVNLFLIFFAIHRIGTLRSSMSSIETSSDLLPDRPVATTFRDELRAMRRIALPIVVVEVGLMLMGTVDTMMVGRISATALASVALGHLYFFIIAAFGMGVLMVLDPIVAQAIGAGDTEAAALGVQRGIVLAVVLGVLISLLMLPAEAAFRAAGQPESIIPGARDFARASIPSFVPFFIFIVLRQSLQATHRVAPIVITVIAGNLLNAALNWVLIFGNLGVSALGVVGTAWATTISRWCMTGMLLALAWPSIRLSLRPWRAETWRMAPLLRMLRLGAPIGFHHQLEGGIFVVVALLMGRIDAVAMAGHQVALTTAALTFMVPLGVSAGGAVLVGHGIGRGDMGEARRAAGAAFTLGVGFMIVSTVVFLTVPHLIARAYTNDASVLAIAVMLIPIAGVFQAFDGMQAVAAGVLRGSGDTRSPVIANLLGFWVIGLPTCIYLGFYTSAGPKGLWWGLVAGLGAVAVVLTILVRRRLRQTIHRVVIDEPTRS